MKVLKLAIKSERWDLAAHTIVLEAAIQLKKEGRENDKEGKAKRGRTKE
jgi:hypothetical protein